MRMLFKPTARHRCYCMHAWPIDHCRCSTYWYWYWCHDKAAHAITSHHTVSCLVPNYLDNPISEKHITPSKNRPSIPNADLGPMSSAAPWAQINVMPGSPDRIHVEITRGTHPDLTIVAALRQMFMNHGRHL